MNLGYIYVIYMFKMKFESYSKLHLLLNLHNEL